MMNDIETRADIERLVRLFYERVRTDEVLAPLFQHVDWEKHLPVMYSFWASMILGEQSYRGSPFEKHAPLPLRADDFRQWVHLFTATVDDCFSGQRADEIKARAQAIAGVFQHKMNIDPYA